MAACGVVQRRHLFDLDGEDAGDDPLASRKRSAILSTVAFLLLGLMMLGLGVLVLASGIAPALGYALIAVSLVRFAAIPLARRGHEATAYLANILAGAVLYVASTLEFGANAGIDIWAPSLVALPTLIADRQHRGLRLGVFVFTLLVVFGAAAAARVLPPRVVVSPETLFELRRVNLASAVLFSAAILFVYRRLLDRAELRVAAAQKLSDRLLGNILPDAIATRLKQDEYPIADQFREITVLFADIVNFTEYAAARPPEEVVEMLNRVFYAFDDMVERLGLEKIKTIGDAYMVAGGVPHARADHAEAVAGLAFEMLEFVAGAGVGLRIGIHSGRVVAGVIGKHKFSYDIWGDTVNTAARLQTSSEPGHIHISGDTARRLGPGWRMEPRGAIELKGLGEVATYFLLGRVADAPAQMSA
jgi:class 3 adenylate cyclase